MSVTWETQMERELEERYSEWRERKTLEQLNDMGIGFLPEDQSYQVYERDYGKPKQFNFMGGLIVAAVLWVPVLAYFWRTR